MVLLFLMGVTPARQIASEVLRRVEAEGAYAADLLHIRLEGVEREDAALATELTLGVLRWRRLLDFLLGRYLTSPVASLDLEVLLALRIGLYQLRFLTRVPARAAVNESVELTKRARKSSAAGLVNAVLRRLAPAARDPVEPLLPPDLPAAERLGILHSHPTWMVARWLNQFSEDRTIAMLAGNNRVPHLNCAVHEQGRREQIIAALQRGGRTVEPGRLLRTALTIHGVNPTETEPYRRGWISIQDEASQMVALLVDVKVGQSVLDLCAAPGGKTPTLARAAGSAALVVAADRHLHRLRATRAHLDRLATRHVYLLALDATRPLPFGTDFDRILVDAPCSGTGTLARNPEIRWRLRSEDLPDFHRRQAALLANAVDRLAPGGRLVYSTCSLEAEENEQVVAKVMENHHEFRHISGETALAPHLAAGITAQNLFDQEGNFRTYPPTHQTDGFFAAILERPMS